MTELKSIEIVHVSYEKGRITRIVRDHFGLKEGEEEILKIGRIKVLENVAGRKIFEIVDNSLMRKYTVVCEWDPDEDGILTLSPIDSLVYWTVYRGG